MESTAKTCGLPWRFHFWLEVKTTPKPTLKAKNKPLSNPRPHPTPPPPPPPRSTGASLARGWLVATMPRFPKTGARRERNPKAPGSMALSFLFRARTWGSFFRAGDRRIASSSCNLCGAFRVASSCCSWPEGGKKWLDVQSWGGPGRVCVQINKNNYMYIYIYICVCVRANMGRQQCVIVRACLSTYVHIIFSKRVRLA